MKVETSANGGSDLAVQLVLNKTIQVSIAVDLDLTWGLFVVLLSESESATNLLWAGSVEELSTDGLLVVDSVNEVKVEAANVQSELCTCGWCLLLSIFLFDASFFSNLSTGCGLLILSSRNWLRFFYLDSWLLLNSRFGVNVSSQSGLLWGVLQANECAGSDSPLNSEITSLNQVFTSGLGGINLQLKTKSNIVLSEVRSGELWDSLANIDGELGLELVSWVV